MTDRKNTTPSIAAARHRQVNIAAPARQPGQEAFFSRWLDPENHNRSNDLGSFSHQFIE
jgi:hypothetical protein